ncbi:hypothetical protein QPR70_18290 [Enterobacter hormaechei]|nr:hypothetical protein [Enterobacter hormaechei]WMA74925.1 hypothetical protein QPR74_18265 [Enterobacter hormaechei]WMA79610.1 hypothetical protein QPR70_18290 [Enterobacter hormaechei]
MKGISQALKSADEVKAVAASLQRNTTTNLFYCLWVFMYESGLRISDVLKLRYEDVEGQSHLKVKQEKNRKRGEAKGDSRDAVSGGATQGRASRYASEDRFHL